MSEKNPYHLRLDLLHMARSIIENNKEKRFALVMNEKAVANYKESDLLVSLEEIIETAKKLNEFVSNKK